MEETTAPSPEYLKGFNEGYLIAKNSPSLAEKLLSVKGDGERLNGLQDGQKQYVLDRAKDKRPAWLKDNINEKQQLKYKSNEKGMDLEP